MSLPDKDQYDPVFLHARREAIVIILLFAGFCIWAVSVCWTQGYLKSDETLAVVETTFGMPTWAFWGVFVPWIVSDAAAVWFCFFIMKPDDLGTAHENEDLQEQLEHLQQETHHE
jgi:hypothetical protein